MKKKIQLAEGHFDSKASRQGPTASKGGISKLSSNGSKQAPEAEDETGGESQLQEQARTVDSTADTAGLPASAGKVSEER